MGEFADGLETPEIISSGMWHLKRLAEAAELL
jgi:hypothetical protein